MLQPKSRRGTPLFLRPPPSLDTRPRTLRYHQLDLARLVGEMDPAIAPEVSVDSTPAASTSQIPPPPPVREKRKAPAPHVPGPNNGTIQQGHNVLIRLPSAIIKPVVISLTGYLMQLLRYRSRSYTLECLQEDCAGKIWNVHGQGLDREAVRGHLRDQGRRSFGGEGNAERDW